MHRPVSILEADPVLRRLTDPRRTGTQPSPLPLRDPGSLRRTLALKRAFDVVFATTLLIVSAPVLAVAAYIACYTLLVAFSLPVATVATLAGGFLFGPWLGTLWTTLGATLGATVIFLAARAALGDRLAAFLRHRAGPRLAALEHELRRNGFHYLLFLRLVPAFPFWLVNLVPALLGVPFRTYVTATFCGIIPGSLVYASVGNGLGAVFDAGATPDLGIIFKPAIILPLVGLAILAILPVAYKKITARQTI